MISNYQYLILYSIKLITIELDDELPSEIWSSIKERKIGESQKCKRETNNPSKPCIFNFIKANDAANQADNIAASIIVDVELIMVGYSCTEQVVDAVHIDNATQQLTYPHLLKLDIIMR